MILGIDATNIRDGGGLTHLKEILANGNPSLFGITKVVLWSSKATLHKLPDFIWLEKITHKYLNKSILFSFIYQKFLLSKSAKIYYKCDLLFVPGGTFLGNFDAIVSMSQNMLPFEPTEYRRFKNWKRRLKFKMLFITQSATFEKSEKVIFLTTYAKDIISSSLNLKETNCAIIPHGISKSFIKEPVEQKPIKEFNQENPFKLLYVSIVTAYKHQWNVAEAVLKLKNEGYPLVLDLVGDIDEESKPKLDAIICSDINSSNTVRYLGLIPYEKLSDYYLNANGFIFASTCENMPIILIEAMTAGLPIACSEYGPMPEVLGDAGIYFDPTNVESIYTAVKEMVIDHQLREEISNKAHNKSINYTWKHCSDETFKYLSKVANHN
jgi:glycosyltransferase involved in cell wall biosynthesis